MSLNYARELLKISISELCSAIGFDTTSQIGIDILVDVCERQFEHLAKQTSNLLQLTNQSSSNFLQLLFLLLQNNEENLEQFEDYIKHFQSIHFSKEILQFPHRKKTQFYLRIPPKDSEQIFERDLNETTEYIYDWLPLFPHQETSEQPSATTLDPTLDHNIFNDQDKKIAKNDSHHPLTLLSFLSKNGDESNIIPVGKRPNRSLPSILYRPRRILEMEAVSAAAEKAKKEQFEKENVEKDQQQSSQPPLRFTIPKTLGNNDKPLSAKKSQTNLDGTMSKKPSSTSALNTNSSSINLNKKLTISPTIPRSNETHSQPNPSTNSVELLTNFDQVDQASTVIAKSITQTTPKTKVPTLKLNIKNVSNTQIPNNSETPTTATKKISKPRINPKPSTNPHQKVNLKIRTSSLPLLGSTPVVNEPTPMISPSFPLPTEIPPPLISLPATIKFSPINDDQQRTETLLTNDLPPQISSENITEEKEKKKKKKKKHHHQNDEKRMKKEEKNPLEPMDIDRNEPSTPIDPSKATPASAGGGGGLRLTIKLGKAPVPSDQISSATNSESIEPPPAPEMKTNPIRLTLSNVPSTIQSNCSSDLPRPPIVSTIDRTAHRKKSMKMIDVPQLNETNVIHFPFHEDNTNSIDDLPLGERTSPNKPIFNPIETTSSEQNFSTPVKKKMNSNKKKSNIKRQNNTVGVAVIEERRIHHDSQEKIWICPSCNRPDNGQEAMIACDLCDDWYHWECVGIVEEPPESIPWFCPKCHRSNSSTTSAQGIKPSASSKAKRQRASALYHQKQQEQ